LREASPFFPTSLAAQNGFGFNGILVKMILRY
jgi:hypothetical protein